MPVVEAIAGAVGNIAQSEIWKNVGAKRRVDAERLQESERTRQLLLQNRLAKTQVQIAQAQQPPQALPAKPNHTVLGISIGIGVFLLLIIFYLILKK